MFSFTQWADLDGPRVRVEGYGQDLAEIIELLLGRYRAEPGPADIEIVLERRARTPTPPAEPARFSFPPLGAWPTEQGFRLVDDVADLTLAAGPEHARLAGWIAEGASMEQLSRSSGLTIWVGLLEALRARGRYPLHGAALVSPAGVPLLLAGTKAAGKSTATLALAERGFRVVSDDTLFVESGPPGLTLLGYKKRFHVRADLLDRRPDLAPLVRWPRPFEPQDKAWIDLEERLPGCTLLRCGAPEVILFPAIVDQPVSQVVPMSGREALMALMAESSFLFVRQPLARPHLAVLAQLVSGARTGRLLAGRDLLADPGRYLELVDVPRQEQPWL